MLHTTQDPDYVLRPLKGNENLLKISFQSIKILKHFINIIGPIMFIKCFRILMDWTLILSKFSFPFNGLKT